MKTVFIDSREDWRVWLEKNHDSVKEIWLVYYKKETGKKSVSYDASVEEALCFGWVDSLIKKIDEAKYARKFTPRKDSSKWSDLNKRRAEKMIKAGLMTDIGRQKIDAAKKSGAWEAGSRSETDLTVSPEFRKALSENPKAKAVFGKLPPSHKREYLGWINSAKRPETTKRRIAEAIKLLTRGEKLGMK